MKIKNRSWGIAVLPELARSLCGSGIRGCSWLRAELVVRLRLWRAPRYAFWAPHEPMYPCANVNEPDRWCRAEPNFEEFPCDEVRLADPAAADRLRCRRMLPR
jgi:hypothetical protein